MTFSSSIHISTFRLLKCLGEILGMFFPHFLSSTAVPLFRELEAPEEWGTHWSGVEACKETMSPAGNILLY